MDVKLPGDDDWFQVDYQFALEEARIDKRRKTNNARGRLSSLPSLTNSQVIGDPPSSTPPAPGLGLGTGGNRQEMTTVRRNSEGVFRWGRST